MLHSPIPAPISKAGLGAASRRAAGRSTEASARVPVPSSRVVHPSDCGCPLVQRGGCSCPLGLPSHFQRIPQAWRGLPGGVPDVYIIPAVPALSSLPQQLKHPETPQVGLEQGSSFTEMQAPLPPHLMCKRAGNVSQRGLCSLGPLSAHPS